MKFKMAPGVFDILPEDERSPWKSSYLWNYVEGEIRKVAGEYGFREMRTPLFERTELFQRGVGESSDIVTKEMYTFDDKGGRSLSLRPEGTAPAIRAFIENGLHNQGAMHKLFYIAPMFRYERSQAGRYRQHHQFGVEAIGCSSPEQDVEVIDLVHTLYKRLGLRELKLCLNTLGDGETRGLYREKIRAYFSAYYSDLTEESRKRLDKNPLRILDTKDPKEREIVAGAPPICDFLTEGARRHFERVQELIASIGIPFTLSNSLVRGLDYYTHTVFEIVAGELGAQNSVVGGGRYDGLVKALGGPDLPACGFGSGIERIIQTMLHQMVPLPERERPTLFLIPLGERGERECFTLLHKLRGEGVSASMDYSGKKLGKLMQVANQLRARYVVVVGDAEVESREVEIKEMESGEKFKMPLSSLSRVMKIEEEKGSFIALFPELSRPFDDPKESEFFVKKIGASINRTAEVTKDLERAIEKMQSIVEN